MKMTFRWYGESDPVKLEYIRQIPGSGTASHRVGKDHSRQTE